MIYDTFLFHGELDLLEIRLNILDKDVDKFVICEARQNFSGTPYESLYLKNKDRFKQWENKIIHFQFNLMEDEALVKQAQESKNTDYGNKYWMKVYYAMEMMRKPLEVCKDEDIVFISDCDEIWNSVALVKEIINNPSKESKIRGFKQLVYYYQLNNRCSEEWTGTVCLDYKRLKQEKINDIKQKGDIKIENGGWHFTYMGGDEAIRFKVESSRELEKGFHNDSFYEVPTEFIIQRAKENKDIFPDDFRPQQRFWVDESEWPEYLKQNRHKYIPLLK